MGRIVVSENVSIDGVVQDPTGEEGFPGGGWFDRIGRGDREAWARAAYEEARNAEALLLGRRSYEFFASRWSSRTGPFAERLNTLPKYVVSSTLEDPEWSNSAVLKGDPVNDVSMLTREIPGEIVVYASASLVHMLFERDLVDEVRLTIYPVVLGAGQRLFAETGGWRAMRLVETRLVGESLAFVRYERVRDAKES